MGKPYATNVRCYWERLGKQLEEPDERTPWEYEGTQTLCRHFWPWLMAGAQTVGHSVIDLWFCSPP